MVEEVKLNRNFAWSPDIYRRGNLKHLRRTSLGRLHHIESLRWKVLLDRERAYAAKLEALRDIERLGFAYTNLVLDEGYDGSSYPRRLNLEESHYSLVGVSVKEDKSHWNVDNKDRHRSVLHELAEVGRVLEWDRDTLPGLLAEVTEERLEAGNRWWRADRRTWDTRRRLDKLEELIADGVRECRICPVGREHVARLYTVMLNGRPYQFEGTYTSVKALPRYWPLPDDAATITPPQRFAVDETLIGQREDVVRTRLGPPEMMIKTRKKCHMFGNVWIYGAAGVRFSEDYRLVDKILTSKEVTRMIRRLERDKLKKRQEKTGT